MYIHKTVRKNTRDNYLNLKGNIQKNKTGKCGRFHDFDNGLTKACDILKMKKGGAVWKQQKSLSDAPQRPTATPL